jgi:hypothetical protein
MELIINNLDYIIGIPIICIGAGYLIYSKVSRYQSQSQAAIDIITAAKENANELCDLNVHMLQSIQQQPATSIEVQQLMERVIQHTITNNVATIEKLDKLQAIITAHQYTHSLTIALLSVGLIVAASLIK